MQPKEKVRVYKDDGMWLVFDPRRGYNSPFVTWRTAVNFAFYLVGAPLK